MRLHSPSVLFSRSPRRYPLALKSFLIFAILFPLRRRVGYRPRRLEALPSSWRCSRSVITHLLSAVSLLYRPYRTFRLIQLRLAPIVLSRKLSLRQGRQGRQGKIKSFATLSFDTSSVRRSYSSRRATACKGSIKPWLSRWRR